MWRKEGGRGERGGEEGGRGTLTIREALHLSDCQCPQLSQLLSTELLLQKLTQRVVLQQPAHRGGGIYIH